jgi:hypothetical protein
MRQNFAQRNFFSKCQDTGNLIRRYNLITKNSGKLWCCAALGLRKIKNRRRLYRGFFFNFFFLLFFLRGGSSGVFKIPIRAPPRPARVGQNPTRTHQKAPKTHVLGGGVGRGRRAGFCPSLFGKL